MIPEILRDKVYYEEDGIILLHGDCLEILPLLEPDSIQCCVTSPPYWGLRDYGVSGQLGLEETPEAYTERMTEVFKGINTALRKDGTLWLNLGDSYSRQAGDDSKKETDSGLKTGRTGKSKQLFKHGNNKPAPGLKPKDLVGIPWRIAFALQSDGWYLRSDIIWSKPNPMPESVTDRPTKAHEYIFLMSKEQKYYYDHEAVKENSTGNTKGAAASFKREASKRGESICPNSPMPTHRPNREAKAYDGPTRNRRSVWTVATKPYPGAHFAVFPPELIEPCILAGTKEGDIVIDPFSGSGTVGQVCKKYKRRYIGIELNEEYLKISPDRIGRQGILL